MKVNELVFIRDKTDLNSVLNKIKNKKTTLFFCLTFEAFYEAKLNNLNYTYAFKLKGINKINFLEKGKKDSQLFIKKFKRKTSKYDLDYLTSRFIIFFSQLIFDKTVINNTISFYKPNKVWIFEEKIKSIIDNGWSQSRGFYYYKILLNKYSINYNVYTYKIIEPKINNFIYKIKKIKSNISFSNLLNSLKLLTIKEPVLIEGFKEKKKLKKLFIEKFSSQFHIITNFKNSFYIRLKYFLSNKDKINFTKKNFKNIKVNNLNYLDLKIEIDSMIEFLINYYNFRNFLKLFLKKKKFKFGIFQQKYESIIAFRKAKITTYQLPHGAIITPELSPMISNYNFFPNLIQKNYHTKSIKFKENFFLGGVPHIDKNLNQNNYKNNIVIFMKNMGMRRWEYDDYEKILEIINFVIKFSKKEKLNLIIKFHPSGGKGQFKYFEKAKVFDNENVLMLLDYDTNKLLNENDIFICLQETSVINQIATMNKEIIFPLFHLNQNYTNNYLFKKIKKALITPKNLDQIGKAIKNIKYNLVKKKKKTKIFKTVFGQDSIDVISKQILSKQI